MEQQFLKFCRLKVDTFDSQLLFFIKEKVNILKNLEQFFHQEKNFIDNIQKKVKKITNFEITILLLAKNGF